MAAILLTLLVSSVPATTALATSPSPARRAAPDAIVVDDPVVATTSQAGAEALPDLSLDGPPDLRNLDLVEALAVVDGSTFDDPAPDIASPDSAPKRPAPDDAAAPAQVRPKATPKPAPARPAVRAAARPARMWAQLHRGLTVVGMATWYPGSLGYAGIAHVAMPGARFLPRGTSAPRARICAAGRCTTVRVVDACACRVGMPNPRLVDLSAGALRALGLDPSRGVYQVRVTLISR